MNREQWQQLQELFHQAVQLDSAERPAFLDQHCSSDPELRQELEQMLAAERKLSPTFLEAAALQQVARDLKTSSMAVVMSPGKRLGPYEIVVLIGAGGMGEVYRARDTRLDRTVAIKVIPRALAPDSVRQQRFEREARAISSLQHPNICTLYDVGSQDGTEYLVMEYLEGETLGARLMKGRLTFDLTLRYAEEVADALDAAHRRGIVHRDLKPGNIFITTHGESKVLDFGLAKMKVKVEETKLSSEAPTAVIANANAKVLTEPGVAMGTVAYMSPEQARGEELDWRTDTFSLGAVLYEMATGRLAFPGKTSAVVFKAILDETPTPPTQVEPSLPAQLDQIVKRALEKDPDLRYQSAADLRADLKRLKRDSDSSRSNVSPTITAARSPDEIKSSKRLGVNWIIGTTLGIALLAGAVWWTRPRAQPQITAVVQLTDDGYQKTWPLVSDGIRVYFRELRAGSWGIAQVSASGGETAPVAAKFPRTHIYDLAPDSSGLLVGVGTAEILPLWIQPLPAGEPQRVGALEASDGSFFPDGQRIVYSKGKTLYVAGKDGSNEQKLADIPDFVGWPRVSPDGRRVRLTASYRDSSMSLWELGEDGKKVHELLKGWHEPPNECCGNWTPDGKYFLFQSLRSGRSDIWAIAEEDDFLNRSKARAIQLTNGPLSYEFPLASRDGKQIFVTGTKKRSELVRYDERSKEFVPYLSDISLIEAFFSPDGQWVAYLSYPDHAVWRMRVNGTEKLRLTSPPLEGAEPRWSRDGKKITFGGRALGKGNGVFVVAADGGSPQRIAEGAEPSWSPDGNTLAYFVRNAATQSSVTGQRELHTRDLRTGKDSVIPDSQGKEGPLWSPDGKFLMAATGEPGDLLLYDFQTQKWSELAKGTFFNWEWSQDAKYVYGVDSGPGEPRAVRIRVADKHVEVITGLKNIRRVDDSFVGYYAGVAPDGSLLLTRDVGTEEIYALSVQWP